MKQNVTRTNFHDAFHKRGQGTRFSYEGLNALYDYLINLEAEAGGVEIELDVIALCCDYTEVEHTDEEYVNYSDPVIILKTSTIF